MNSSVLIIGAGIAGLSTAKELQKLGINYIILDSDVNIGGRIQTDIIKGFQIDRGFQVLLDSYKAVNYLINIDNLKLYKFDSGAIIFNKDKNTFKKIYHPFKHPSYILKSLFNDCFTWQDKAILARLAFESIFNYRIESEYDFRKDLSTIEQLTKLGLSQKAIDLFFTPFFEEFS